MDDAQWVLKQDIKEKKITARSARKKARHTGCKLPSDYLTSKQKKQLNGEVICMNIRKPMTYKYFKTLPKDLQEEFLDYVVSTFHVTAEILCKEMFNITAPGLRNYIRTKNMKSPWTRGQHMPQFDRERWEKFLAGEEVEEPQNASESLENDLCEMNTSSEGTDITAENEPEDVILAKQLEEEKREPTVEEKKRLSHLCVEQHSEINRLKTLNDIFQKENEVRQYIENDIRTLDEVVMEQPFEVGSLNFNLKNIRDWDALKNCLSAFPLPKFNSVTITVHALREE